jgi:hypothetical protein
MAFWRAFSSASLMDRGAIVRDRQRGQSLGQLARNYNTSRATIHRVLREHAANQSEQVA